MIVYREGFAPAARPDAALFPGSPDAPCSLCGCIEPHAYHVWTRDHRAPQRGSAAVVAAVAEPPTPDSAADGLAYDIRAGRARA